MYAQYYPVKTKKPTAYPLTERAVANLRTEFIVKRKHILTTAHWAGIEDVCKFMEDQARDAAGYENAYSPLPVGTGKSSAVVEMTRQFVGDPAYADVGVIILVHQLDQIRRFVADIFGQQELAKPHNERRFAIITGRDNKELNEMGRGAYKTHKDGTVTFESDHQNAQVLFVTQAKLLSLVAYTHIGKDFEGHYATKVKPEDAELLKANPQLKQMLQKHIHFWFYNGHSRQVRVWDESIEAAKPLVIRPKQMHEAATRLMPYNPKQAQQIIDIALDATKKAAEGATTYTFPCLGESYWGLGFLPTKEDEGVDDPLHIIFRLYGGGADTGVTVRLFRDPRKGAGDGTVLYYRELLPKNFAPCLVLDASGQFRVLYDVWPSDKGGGMKPLRTAPKTYTNLTVRHWDRPAGKAEYRKEDARTEMGQAIARVISGLPKGERALVVYRKPEKDFTVQVPDVVRESVKALGGDPNLIEFLTWGRHTATNDYHSIKHVIICGLLQYDTDMNEALFRAASYKPSNVEVTAADLERTRVGEIAHHLFQAVGRGAIRRMKDGDCPEGCTLHAVFSAHDVKAHSLFGWVFPGATVEGWFPDGALKQNRLKSKNREDFFDALIRRLDSAQAIKFERRDLEGAFSAGMIHRYLYEAMGHDWKDKALFDALAERGLRLSAEEFKRRGGTTHLYTLVREGEAPEQPISTSC